MLVVMGLAGAGKTTVLNELLKRRKDIKTINYGDLAVNLAIKKGLVKNRDEISFLSALEHTKLQKEVVAQLRDTKKTILDTHAILRKKIGYIAGLTPDLFEKIKIEGFVYIDAPTEEILERRKKDKTRKRMILKKEEIDKDRLISLVLIGSYAAKSGAPFFLIQNKNKKLKEAVIEFEKCLESIGW